MIYVSIDIETTGLKSKENQIIEFAAIIEDTNNPLPIEKLPKFHVYVKNPKDLYFVGGFCLKMHGRIYEDMFSSTPSLPVVLETDLAEKFFYFLQKYLKIEEEKNHHRTDRILITVAGKNFGTFDKLFLEEIPDWKKYIQIRQRIIDPTIFFIDWEKDEDLPNLTTCKERAGISGDVTHRADEDAIDVILLLRTQYVKPDKL